MNQAQTTRNVLDALGRQAVMERLSVSDKSVSRAATVNQFPASWYAVLRDMCDKAGIECPDQIFNFKPRGGVDQSERSAA